MTMPGPAHQVSRSTALLVRLGYTRRQALETVVTVCYAARHILDPDGELAPGWLDQLQAEAERRLAAEPVPPSEGEANEHGHRIG